MPAIINPQLLAKARPRRFFDDRELMNYLDLMERVLQQIYRNIGGADEAIDDGSDPFVDVSLDFESSLIPIVSTSSAYTTRGDVLLVVTGEATITLDEFPADNQKTIVKRATSAGYVTVDGNGKTIDGGTMFTMVNNYDSFTFVYSRDAGEWVIV